MQRPMPLVTLAAGVLLGGVVLGVDLAATDGEPAATSEYAAPGRATPTTAPPPAASPSAEPAEAPVAEGSYAGYATVKGERVPLAVTVAGTKAIAYLCDGVSLEAWFRGAATPRLGLAGKNGAKLTGAGGPGGTVVGEITLRGGTHPYTLKVAKRPSGLYRATSATRDAVTGWIVQDDGRQTGLSTTPDGGSVPAPRLDPATLTATVDGSPVQAAPADPNA